MSGFQSKLGWIWIASALLSSSALADSVTSLRRELSQVRQPVVDEMKLSDHRTGAGLACQFARKNLQSTDSAASAASSASDQGAGGTRAL